MRNKSPHVTESKAVFDSGFQAVDSGSRVLDSGFQSSVNSLSYIPYSKAQDSGFDKQKFHGSRNPYSLTGGEKIIRRRF